jgi:hypothetical protein
MHLLIYAAKHLRRWSAADHSSMLFSVLDTGSSNEHAVALARHCFLLLGKKYQRANVTQLD